MDREDELCPYSGCSHNTFGTEMGLEFFMHWHVECLSVWCAEVLYSERGKKENRRTYKLGINKYSTLEKGAKQNKTKHWLFFERAFLFCRLFLSLALSYVSSSLDSGNLVLAGISQLWYHSCCCVLLSAIH